MRHLARLGIVAAYVGVFWILLPAGLWAVATRLDALLGWQADPWAPGGLLLLVGAGLLAWGMAELWSGGGGLPVSALPPPRLARRGPYRHCRHPIYLGFQLALPGAGLVLGSPALVVLVTPAFVPVWVAYARWEERGLVRRFGEDYRRYQGRVGWVPRWGLYRLTQALMTAGLVPTTVTGRHQVPRRGGCVLVASHACYLDPCFVGRVTPRPVSFTTTAEAYRSGLTGRVVRRFVNIPVRRYRPDPVAAREVLRRLGAGEIVGIFPEGERSPLGVYQGAMADVAGILARLPVPVIPIGLSGNYQAGPRWAQVLRRRPVRVRVGPPVDFDGREPCTVVDEALSALLDADPQPVDLAGLPLERLERVLWACPACLDEASWQPEALCCGACGSRWQGTPQGELSGPGGHRTLAELARLLWDRPEEGRLEAEAEASVEEVLFGPIAPLEPLGRDRLVLDATSLRWRDLVVPMADIRSTSTERADTLQVATSSHMWQFLLSEGSVFRLHRAVERWSRAARPKPRVRRSPRPPPPRAERAGDRVVAAFEAAVRVPGPWSRGLWATARADYGVRRIPEGAAIQVLEAAGRRRRVLQLGGAGRPLVVLPGLHASLDEGLFADLAQRAALERPVWLLEDRLAGPTLALNDGDLPSLRQLVCELEALLDALGTVPDVLALSAGATVALALAPGRIHRLVGWSAVLEPAATVAAVRGSLALRTYYGRVHRRVFRQAGQEPPPQEEVWTRLLSERAPPVDGTPTLLVHGAADPVAPLGPVRAAAPGRTVRVLSGGGHLGQGAVAGDDLYLLPLAVAG